MYSDLVHLLTISQYAQVQASQEAQHLPERAEELAARGLASILARPGYCMRSQAHDWIVIPPFDLFYYCLQILLQHQLGRHLLFLCLVFVFAILSNQVMLRSTSACKFVRFCFHSSFFGLERLFDNSKKCLGKVLQQETTWVPPHPRHQRVPRTHSLQDSIPPLPLSWWQSWGNPLWNCWVDGQHEMISSMRQDHWLCQKSQARYSNQPISDAMLWPAWFASVNIESIPSILPDSGRQVWIVICNIDWFKMYSISEMAMYVIHQADFLLLRRKSHHLYSWGPRPILA